MPERFCKLDKVGNRGVCMELVHFSSVRHPCKAMFNAERGVQRGDWRDTSAVICGCLCFDENFFQLRWVFSRVRDFTSMKYKRRNWKPKTGEQFHNSKQIAIRNKLIVILQCIKNYCVQAIELPYHVIWGYFR